jgi:hypothetical protein
MITTLIIILIFTIPGIYIWADYYKQGKRINLNFNKLIEYISSLLPIRLLKRKRKNLNFNKLIENISSLLPLKRKRKTIVIKDNVNIYSQTLNSQTINSETVIIQNLIYEIKNDFINQNSLNKNKITKTQDGWIYNFSPDRKIYIEKNKLSLFDLNGINRSIYVNNIHMKIITDFFKTIYIIANNS